MRRPSRVKTLPTKGQINLYGVDDPTSGLGVAVRSTEMALNAVYGDGFVRRFNINHIERTEPADINIIQFDPSLGLAWARHVRQMGHQVIGYWVFEGSTPFKVMLENWKDYDAIWTPSNFCQDRLTKFGIPAYTIPHPMEAPSYRRPADEPVRNFLILANSASNWNRKNVIGGIRAFIQAKMPDACLHVHCLNLEPEQRKEIKWHQEVCDRIYVSTEKWSPEDLEKIWELTDCLISLHRSEGFGLAIAEAQHREIPTIATGYSGNVDFNDIENLVPFKTVDIDDIFFPDGLWASPDIQRAAVMMRELYDGKLPDLRAQRIQVQQWTDPVTIGEEMKEEIDALRANLP